MFLTVGSRGFKIGSKVCAWTFEKDTPQKIYRVFGQGVVFEDTSAQAYPTCIDSSTRDGTADWSSVRSVKTLFHRPDNMMDTLWRMGQKSGKLSRNWCIVGMALIFQCEDSIGSVKLRAWVTSDHAVNETDS
jgi:hypothetical protein